MVTQRRKGSFPSVVASATGWNYHRSCRRVGRFPGTANGVSVPEAGALHFRGTLVLCDRVEVYCRWFLDLFRSWLPCSGSFGDQVERTTAFSRVCFPWLTRRTGDLVAEGRFKPHSSSVHSWELECRAKGGRNCTSSAC